MTHIKTEQQKAEEKLVAEVSKFVISFLIDWSKKSVDPEFKKTILGLSSYGSKHLWERHGDHVKKHILSIYNEVIDSSHGKLSHDYERHAHTAAKNAANDIWESYSNH
jgi:hypothetical protein